MEDIERLRLIVHHFDPENIPSTDRDLFGRASVQDLAFSLYHANRNQRQEPWLDNREPSHFIRILLWLKSHTSVLYPS